MRERMARVASGILRPGNSINRPGELCLATKMAGKLRSTRTRSSPWPMEASSHKRSGLITEEMFFNITDGESGPHEAHPAFIVYLKQVNFHRCNETGPALALPSR